MSDDRYAAGMAVRRGVLGEAHVERAEARKSELDADFQRFITESAWGSVWSRPGLERRTRSLLTLALLAGLGHWEEFAMHLRASRNTGASPEEIREALFHVAIYAGLPAANRGFAILKQVFEEESVASGQEGDR
ncbi:MAG TPA: 4-carboxymuconolactone decarboxylase [Kiloniellales bacterium]|nr:4-carboxymuconolactone decarboxylase [Kiloniellales bacterium]